MDSGKNQKRNAADDRTSHPEGEETVRIGSQREASEPPKKFAVSLVIKKGRKKGAEYTISMGRTVIGRGTGADIIIDDPAVSRMHAAIEFMKTKFVLKDLGSANGTLLDGKSINEADLSHGSRFQIGDTIIEFVLTEKSGGSVYVLE
jgi:predicted component of type VI protein secretion system